MKHSGSQSGGSFTAWGTGFNYEYISSLKKLDVFHAKTGSALITIDFDKHLSRNPAEFVSTLDKSCQVRALTLSNNTSIDLSQTFDDNKLTPMLVESTRIARYAFDLMQNNFERFEQYFCEDNTIQKLRVRRVRRFENTTGLYSAHLETRRNNKVGVESSTLHGVMSKLSHSMVQDLIAHELTARFDEFAHTLLSASSKVSILSLILNEKFAPSRKLKGNITAPGDDSQANN